MTNFNSSIKTVSLGGAQFVFTSYYMRWGKGKMEATAESIMKCQKKSHSFVSLHITGSMICCQNVLTLLWLKPMGDTTMKSTWGKGAYRGPPHPCGLMEWLGLQGRWHNQAQPHLGVPWACVPPWGHPLPLPSRSCSDYVLESKYIIFYIFIFLNR